VYGQLTKVSLFFLSTVGPSSGSCDSDTDSRVVYTG
jgi:hypothetical protein